MAYEQKMFPTDKNPMEFIEEQAMSKNKKKDVYDLLDIFEEETKRSPLMWGPSIIGFGEYHYTYDSGHSGKAPLVGFSPKKSTQNLYLYGDEGKRKELLGCLGKHRSGAACIYVNKLADIDLSVLRELINVSVEDTLSRYPNNN